MRLAAIVAVVALFIAGATAAAPASGGAMKRSTSVAAKKSCAKKPSRRARTSCRRARTSAGFRRGARRGRALLAPRAATRPSATGPGLASTDPLVPGPPAPPTGVAPSPPGTTDPAPVSSTIGAEAYDFGTFVLRLTKASVPAGDLTIYFRNYDVSDHNLWIAAPAARATAPVLVSEAVGEGGGATKTVAVTAGTWRFYCSLDGHESMTRDLAVQ